MMENYILQTSLSLILLYVLFRTMRSNELNHQIIRITGLLCLFIAFTFPLIPFHYLFPANEYSTTIYTTINTSLTTESNVSGSEHHSPVGLIGWMYFAGVSLVLLRSVYGLFLLTRLYFLGSKTKSHGFTVVKVNMKLSPFTFFHFLFLGNSTMDKEEEQTMILHEKFHREQRHSLDNVLLEIVSIFFWFHPAIWLFRRDIKASHEYLADECVLQTGMDPLDYQQLLFRSRTGISLPIGSFFSYKINLNHRFRMMLKQKPSPQKSLIRVLIFAPLMLSAVILASCQDELDYANPEVLAEYSKGETAMYKTIAQGIKYPAISRKESRAGQLYVNFTVNKNGEIENVHVGNPSGKILEEIVVIGYGNVDEPNQTELELMPVDDVLKEEAVRVIKTLGKFTPAQENGEFVNSVLTMPITFKLDLIIEVPMSEESDNN